jgi:hypothetical protein
MHDAALHRLDHLKASTRAIAIDFQGVMFVDRPDDIGEDDELGYTSHVARLAELLEGHDDIAVAVTSSWRSHLDDDQLADRLPGLERWYVGSVGMPRSGRDVALRAWLASHRQIADFIVLDDQRRLYPGDWPQLIVCDSALGLADPKAMERLKSWIG